MLHELIVNGMNAARLNLSHGTHDDHAARAELIREAQQEAGRPIAIIGDLQGPKIRVGDLDSPMALERGSEVVVVADGTTRNGELPVAPAAIGDVLHPGHEVLIDDGLVRLRVEEVEAGRARCGVLVGGLVSSHKGVNLPGVPLPIPSLTRKDIEDLEFALELGVDFVALSFVRSAADVHDLKALIEQAGSHAHVIAKIEKAEAIDVARRSPRGDRRRHGRARRPRRRDRVARRAADAEADHRDGARAGEARDHRDADARVDDPLVRADARRGRDVANAVIDGTSAVMLSGETAVGGVPDRVGAQWTDSLAPSNRRSVTDIRFRRRPMIRRSAMRCRTRPATSRRRSAPRRMLVPTFTGRTASAVARLRPRRSAGAGEGGRLQRPCGR